MMIDYHRIAGNPPLETTSRCEEHGQILGTLEYAERHTKELHPLEDGFRVLPPKDVS